MEEMSVQVNINVVLMSNIQVMVFGNLVGDDIMVQIIVLQVSDQIINGCVMFDDVCIIVDFYFIDVVGDDYIVLLILEGSLFVGSGQVDFLVNFVDYGILLGDYDVLVVINIGEEEVLIEVFGEVEDVCILFDGSFLVFNVVGVGEVLFIMISQFGVFDVDSDVV